MIQIGTIFTWDGFDYRIEAEGKIWGFHENKIFEDSIYRFASLQTMLEEHEITIKQSNYELY